MAPALQLNETLVVNQTAVSSLCQFLPSVVTLIYLCTNSSHDAGDSSRADSSLRQSSWSQQLLDADVSEAGGTIFDGSLMETNGSSTLGLSTDRGPPPCAPDSWNCTDTGRPDYWPLLEDDAPRNETDEERETRLYYERINRANLTKAYVLIGVVVVALLSCFKVVFQLFVTYSSDPSDKNDR